MVPKNERFEMRLDEGILLRVDSWRAEQPDIPSRAEAMRRLVELGLGRTRADAVRFSDGEKLLLMMLGDLYKHLKVGKGEIDADFVAQVIFGGHYWAPKWDMVGLFHDHEDDPHDVHFVVQVLVMWEFVERGYERLSKKQRDKVAAEAEPFGKNVALRGFDGNSESAHLGIARFLIDEMGRFAKFKGRELNSHMPMLAAYQRMLDAFEPMQRGLVGDDLSATQIVTILSAQRHRG
jgi:uncharacterized protein YfbU (UPF0304 family)